MKINIESITWPLLSILFGTGAFFFEEVFMLSFPLVLAGLGFLPVAIQKKQIASVRWRFGN